MPDTHFSHTDEKLRQIAKDVLDHAAERGASAAETEVSEGFGQTVTVRRGEVETIEHNRDKGIGVTVYIGKQRGHASTTDFTPQAIRDTVDAALSIARFTASDDCAGLADEDMLAREIPDLDLWHPWGLPVERAIELAQRLRRGGLRGRQQAHELGGRERLHPGIALRLRRIRWAFSPAIPSSRHGIWCALIAGKNDEMQRDDWYESSRDPAELAPPESVGRRAGERAAKRAGRAQDFDRGRRPCCSRRRSRRACIGHFVSAVSGGSLYRKSSFLLDSMGQQVFAPLVQLSEAPHLRKGLASAGVRRGRRRDAPARGGAGTASCRAIFSAATRRAS